MGKSGTAADMLLQVHRHSFARHAQRGRYSNGTDAARKRGFRGSRQRRPQRVDGAAMQGSGGWLEIARGDDVLVVQAGGQWLVASAAALDRQAERALTPSPLRRRCASISAASRCSTRSAPGSSCARAARFAGARHRRQHRERAAEPSPRCSIRWPRASCPSACRAAARPLPGDPGDAGVCRRGDLRLPRRIARAARLFRPGLHARCCGRFTNRRGSEPSRWWRRCSASACRRCRSSGCCRS